MLHNPVLIPPRATFWQQAAHALLGNQLLFGAGWAQSRDLSALRVVVPTFVHAQALKIALAAQLPGAFIPPRITTLPAWLAMLPPEPDTMPPGAASERLMSLYGELRQHAWLKKIFSARRNTDLLPLAKTLLTLSDELTQSLLPTVQAEPGTIDERWETALGQLAPSARHLLSEEAQLVWSIWKGQLAGNDACVDRFAKLMRLAGHAESPMIWISPTAPDCFEQAFLDAYGKRQTVLPILLDWGAASVPLAYSAAWRELPDGETSGSPLAAPLDISAPKGLAICACKNLEDEALRGAQTIIDWLAAGKTKIAIVAQDRVVARRIQALLTRAQIAVADETGWKLSTTRAAAAIAAWFDVVASRAETVALLDFLKSPFLLADAMDKSDQVIAIEMALRRANVPGGWPAVISALAAVPLAQAVLLRIEAQAKSCAGRKSVAEWIDTTAGVLDRLGMRIALENDAAGLQVLTMIEAIRQDCAVLTQVFSFSEWRAFISLQLETTAFVPGDTDDRVVMLPLNGARLRTFDAVLMVGADADHLPSKPNEALFFANAVRRELGLATREKLQRQQLRDFAELLCANDDVILSWQAHKDGEPNPAGVWIERLQLTLARSNAEELRLHHVDIPHQLLTASPPACPAPAAPGLLPAKLSASGYNSFVACPYQFFATRMLGLSGLDELSDMPEKRDYGDWLHRILKTYHENVRDQELALSHRAAELQKISDQVFNDALARNSAALGYYARWQKAIPAYLAWANEREARGWRFVIGEQWFEKTLQLSHGEITLRGCIDRIDENDAGERAVLDYKTRATQALRDKLKEKEDHQLAFYGLLSDAPVTSASYVALEVTNGKTGEVEAANYVEWQQALATQIDVGMRAVALGAALPASGIELICQFCDVRGLCRKGNW
ncbi:MAG: helicase I [Burkholderiales bacterium RIFCSPLOWO2_02_FULL_57_36]|nr:MAG: helicase I [Burkholderiales bacterium RIFCSPLOWO2_02_FULL_57_36]